MFAMLERKPEIDVLKARNGKESWHYQNGSDAVTLASISPSPQPIHKTEHILDWVIYKPDDHIVQSVDAS